MMINKRLTKIKDFLKSDTFKLLSLLLFIDSMYSIITILGFTTKSMFIILMLCSGVPILIAINIGELIQIFDWGWNMVKRINIIKYTLIQCYKYVNHCFKKIFTSSTFWAIVINVIYFTSVNHFWDNYEVRIRLESASGVMMLITGLLLANSLRKWTQKW